MSRDINSYFDNAASSFPKPFAVAEGVKDYINNTGGTYGRSAHSKVYETTCIVEDCRDMMMDKLGAKDGYLCWAANATDAVNILLSGIQGSLERVLVTGLEHNGVMRILVGLNISYDIVASKVDGTIDLEKLSEIDFSQYSMIFVNHQSNVNGAVQCVKSIKRIVGDLPIFVDTTQSLGEREFMADEWGVDYAVFTAHKALLGVPGLGGFYAKDISAVKVTRFGGTGSNSESLEMPDFYPDKFQCGTPNIVGIVALYHALENVPEPQHSFEDFVELLDKVSAIDGLVLYTSEDYSSFEMQGEVFSVIYKNMPVSEFSQLLNEKYNIATRSGLHCAPLAHDTLQTIQTGTVRFSLSAYHTKEDLDYLYDALINICK